MGVTIHYRGRLKSPDLIQNLTHEVEEICISNNWKYNVLTDEIAQTAGEIGDVEIAETAFAFSQMRDMRGITFQPHPDSEAVSLIFDKDGALISFLGTMFNSLGRFRNHCFVKTQFAGADAHIRIINLFIYLKKKYFKQMIIHDEGGYYPNNDMAALEKRMGFINSAIETLNDLFEYGINDGDTPEDIMKNIQKALTASFKGAQVHIIRIDPSEMRDKMRLLSEAIEKAENDENTEGGDEAEKKANQKRKSRRKSPPKKDDDLLSDFYEQDN
jgi:hypothetical protein